MQARNTVVALCLGLVLAAGACTVSEDELATNGGSALKLETYADNTKKLGHTISPVVCAEGEVMVPTTVLSQQKVRKGDVYSLTAQNLLGVEIIDRLAQGPDAGPAPSTSPPPVLLVQIATALPGGKLPNGAYQLPTFKTDVVAVQVGGSNSFSIASGQGRITSLTILELDPAFNWVDYRIVDLNGFTCGSR
jgi:hypothetical protein